MISITQKYQEILDMGDPRVASWPLMNSPVKAIVLVVTYLSFVKVIGPAWMRNKKPYVLRYPMIIYNMAICIVSGWLFMNFGMLGWFTHYSWRCEPVDYSNNPHAIRMAEMTWYYYLTKFIEFADTIFFVLRKKDSQITPLHIFHHSLVPITLWIGIKYAPGGYNTLFPLLNTFVHTFMYLYYGIAALGPAYQKYLWWKKYMTILQLVQFSLVFAFMMQLTFFPTCEVTKAMLALSLIQAIIFFGLFLKFFSSSHKKLEQKKRENKQTIAQDYSKNESSEKYEQIRHRKPSQPQTSI